MPPPTEEPKRVKTEVMAKKFRVSEKDVVDVIHGAPKMTIKQAGE